MYGRDERASYLQVKSGIRRRGQLFIKDSIDCVLSAYILQERKQRGRKENNHTQKINEKSEREVKRRGRGRGGGGIEKEKFIHT